MQELRVSEAPLTQFLCRLNLGKNGFVKIMGKSIWGKILMGTLLRDINEFG